MENLEEDPDDFPVLRRHSSIRSLVNFKGKRKVRQEDSISYCGEFDTLSIAGEKGKFQDQLSTFRRRLSKKLGSVKDFSKRKQEVSPSRSRRKSDAGSSLSLSQVEVLIHHPPSPGFQTRLEIYEEDDHIIKQSSRKEVPICWINYENIIDDNGIRKFSEQDILVKLFSRVSTRYIARHIMSFLTEDEIKKMSEVSDSWSDFVSTSLAISQLYK